MKKLINVAFVVGVSLLFTACTSKAPTLPDSPSFTQGKIDGCETATGEYKKNGDAFKMDTDYKNGWYYGRKDCNPSQTNK